MELVFLEAACGTPLTKSFDRKNDGSISKSSYPLVSYFTSHSEKVDSIDDFHAVIKKHSDVGDCLLKGQLDRPLFNERRAGHTNADTPTEWAALDNDGLDDLSPGDLMNLVGLGDIDYIVQYSASAGITGPVNRYHTFFLLEQPMLPAALKVIVKRWNLAIPDIGKHLRLTKTQCALRYPLDVSINQNDKLIYIAEPNIAGDVEVNLTEPRYNLVRGSKRRGTIS